MELFQRQIQARVVAAGADTLQVEVRLDDTHHEIELKLEVRTSSRTITSIQAQFIRTPYDRCGDTAALLESLVGVTVTPGVRRIVSRRVGGQEGCTHLYELVMEALRVTMQGYYRSQWGGSEAEMLTFLRRTLAGECYIYSHPERKAKFLLLPQAGDR